MTSLLSFAALLVLLQVWPAVTRSHQPTKLTERTSRNSLVQLHVHPHPVSQPKTKANSSKNINNFPHQPNHLARPLALAQSSQYRGSGSYTTYVVPHVNKNTDTGTKQMLATRDLDTYMSSTYQPEDHRTLPQDCETDTCNTCR